jgi:hypothetical protein
MKKIFLLVICAGLAAVSCSHDDDKGTNTDPSLDLVGVYRMTAWNAPVAVDYDGNGISSANLMNETPCFNNSQISINADKTFSFTYNSVAIDTISGSTCHSLNSVGNWVRHGNTVTIISAATDTLTLPTSSNFIFVPASVATAPLLISSLPASLYPSINADTGAFEYATGDVNFVMTKDTISSARILKH